MERQPQTELLFIIPNLEFGGSEKMLVNLVNRMDQALFNIQVVSLGLDNPFASQIQPEVAKVHFFPRLWRYDLGPASQIRKLILESQIDTVVGFDLFSYFYIWRALAGISHKPKIFLPIHNFRAKTLRQVIQNIVYARLLSGTEKIISVCNSQTDYWSKAYWIPRSRFSTIYNGVDSEFFCPSKDPEKRRMIRASLAIPESAFVILQVANLYPHKRHEDALIALKKVIDINPGRAFYLVIVGPGSKEREQKLQNLAEQLKISSQVRFCGGQGDVRPFHESADVFTLPSSLETFSVAALEAMAMGLPCVLTDIGGAREMVLEGFNGYIVQPKNPPELGNRWLDILNHPERFDRNQIRAWVVDHYSLVECVHQYEQFLTK
jgi:glycosyltransferase involved in cell wall biosynthesis